MLTVMRCEADAFLPAGKEELPALLAAGTLVWVDLESPSDQEARELLDGVFGFHRLAVDDCLNRRVDPPKADDYGEYLFCVFQGIDFLAQTESVQTTELDIFIGRSYVVSYHQRPLHGVAEVRERLQKAAPLPARGPDWLAHALVDTLVDHILPDVEDMDEQISDLEDAALERPGPELIQRMTALKRGILRLRRAIAPQRDVINRLSRGDFHHLIGAETAMYYRDVYDHLMRLEDMVESLRDLGDSVISVYLATVNNRMNEVMKSLSVVGTIFLPLTLIASVFGTNFSPTYEAWGWPGFLAMVAALFGLAIFVWWFFRLRRWL